jgi:starvation-inducible DNA-binding protein
MEYHTGMTEKNRQQVGDALARLLAETYAIYLKTQHFHWNVTGPEFFSLHLLFEKQYNELAEAIDEIAERIRALGFYVDGTFSGFKELSSIKDDDKVLVSKEMVHKLALGHEVVIRHARQLAALAEREHDPATVDLMGRRLNAHEKFYWMLRSHL